MSAILSADDLNDFISPGVACIKPVETLPKQEDSNPYEVTTEDKVQAQNPAPASISLTDCLACSGCVTSAEAVLVSLQSHTEVLNTLDSYPSIDLRTETSIDNIPSNAKVFVASVSPQVRASIAATFGISERRAGFLIEQFLSGSQGLRIGGRHNSAFDYVVDTNRMREACLVLSAQEVKAAMADKSTPRPILTSACPGWICYAEKTHPHVLPHLSALKSPQALSGTLLKSVLSKTLNIHPSQIWHLAIMPCFDKKLEASREELTDRWWSPTEKDSTTPAVRDVDCVITSKELLTLAEARGIQLLALPQTPLLRHERASFPDSSISNFLFGRSPHPTHSFPQGQGQGQTQSSLTGTSGGYLAHILQTYQNLHPGSTITSTRGRNADVIEYTLHQPSTPHIPLLKAARYYGFRNIQNLVRKLKPARQSRLPGATSRRSAAGSAGASASAGEYAYVEVMACPGGCTNGGGQIKIEDVATTIPLTRGEAVDPKNLNTSLSQKEWLARVDEAYFSADSTSDGSDDEMNLEFVGNGNGNGSGGGRAQSNGIENGNGNGHGNLNGHHDVSVDEFLSHWARVIGVPLEKLVYTTYRKVESDVGKTRPGAGGNGMSDSQRIAAIAGLEGGGW